MSLRPVSAAFAALLAACTSQQWGKPGVAADVQARDVAGCRQAARTQSYHELNARVLAQPYGTGIDPRGHATLAPPLAAEGDRVMIEQQLMQNCMRGLGYQLEARPENRGETP